MFDAFRTRKQLRQRIRHLEAVNEELLSNLRKPAQSVDDGLRAVNVERESARKRAATFDAALLDLCLIPDRYIRTPGDLPPALDGRSTIKYGAIMHDAALACEARRSDEATSILARVEGGTL